MVRRYGVAAWLIGLDQRTQFRQALGDLLLTSELVYSGQGYCFALACFGQPERLMATSI